MANGNYDIRRSKHLDSRLRRHLINGTVSLKPFFYCTRGGFPVWMNSSAERHPRWNCRPRFRRAIVCNGAACGNWQSLSAAVAAGILAIGDEHGGAGSTCMEIIAAGAALAAKESISNETATVRTATDARANKKRLPGLGHRVPTATIRTPCQRQLEFPGHDNYRRPSKVAPTAATS